MYSAGELRFVRVEAVDHHREGLAPLGLFEGVGGVLVHARGTGLLLVLAPSGVGQVLAHAGDVTLVAQERGGSHLSTSSIETLSGGR